MEKTVKVVDESGNIYEPTWPKRAEGLVKHGRARYVDERTICLARPPQENDREDTVMSENTKSISLNTETGEVTQNAAAPDYSIEYILTMLERIRHDSEYIIRAVAELGSLQTPDAPCLQLDTRGEAIGRVVEAREQTNRDMIALLREMYEDLRRESAVPSMPDPQQLLSLVQENVDGEVQLRAIKLLEKMYG